MQRVVCQVLVATSTLAWGVNTPAHLVVIKGTEFFDAPTRSASCLACGTAASICQQDRLVHAVLPSAKLFQQLSH